MNLLTHQKDDRLVCGALSNIFQSLEHIPKGFAKQHQTDANNAQTCSIAACSKEDQSRYHNITKATTKITHLNSAEL